MRNKWLTVDCGWCAGAVSPVAGTATSLLRFLGWAILLVVGTLLLTGVAIYLTYRRPAIDTGTHIFMREYRPSPRCGQDSQAVNCDSLDEADI